MTGNAAENSSDMTYPPQAFYPKAMMVIGIRQVSWLTHLRLPSHLNRQWQKVGPQIIFRFTVAGTASDFPFSGARNSHFNPVKEPDPFQR
jgi:hypothetical protein